MVRLRKKYRGYSELALRRVLQVPRLTQEGTKSIPTLLAPSMTKSGEKELLFLFTHAGNYPDEDEGVDVLIEKRFTIASAKVKLDVTLNACRQHAAAKYQQSMKSTPGAGIAKAMVASCVPLEEWLEQYNAARKKRTKLPGVQRGGSFVAAACSMVMIQKTRCHLEDTT